MDIKKILFIRPGIRLPRTAFSQSLGILYIISYLRKKFPGEFEIKIIEQRLYGLSFDEVKKQISDFNPDVVGFSCLTMESNDMSSIAAIVKELNPKCLTVLGGPHATVFYDQALTEATIDFVVIGSGEVTFAELIRTLKTDAPLDQVKGIAFKRNGDIAVTPPRESVENLDDLPMPAWDMVDFKQYSKQISMNIYNHRTPWAAVFTSRGCPYQCAYCHNIFGKKTRLRSAENVVDEIELLSKRYSVKEIQIVDDIFNFDLKRAKKICDLILERNIKIKIAFPNGLRGDIIDKELIQKLKKAGCYSITYAIETASPRIQKLIHKNLNLEKVLQAIAWTDEERIATRGFFMLGFPGETMEEINATINFALKSKLLTCSFFSVLVYPRSKLIEIAKDIYPDFDFSSFDTSDFYYWKEKSFYAKATGVDLFTIQYNAYRRFHLRPKTILRILFRYPRILFFARGVFYGLQTLFSSFINLEKIFRPKQNASAEKN
jgi:anaerobic magnesium-protoporphyrin IX monomethyl ester cyclase